MIALSLHENPLVLSHCPHEPSTGVDETFGLAGSLWPMIHSLAAILASKKRGADVEQEAQLLEIQLRSWSIERIKDAVDETHVNQEAMLQIARAYKYSSLLTLYSTMPQFEDREDVLQDTYRQAFDSLLRVCALSGTMSTLTWPLYTVALLARSMGDRTIVRHIFSKLIDRQHMKIVEEARDSAIRHWDKTREIQDKDNVAILLG